MERTFIAIKPDGVQRGLVGKIISIFELKGFKLLAMKFVLVDKEQAEEHYKEHNEKQFFKNLVSFICSGPIVAMVWEGKNIVNAIRSIMGKTNPLDAQPGTIRGDFALDIGRNVIHGSDSIENAEREISIFFKQSEIVEWKSDIHKWLYEF